MSPRIQSSRHAVPAPGPYQGPRVQPQLRQNVPYTSSSMVDDLDDGVPQHFSLSSNGPYMRSRHDQGPSWNTSHRSFFPDQATYAALPQTTQGPYTMNPVDAVYSHALMSGYETTAALDTTPDLFSSMDIAPVGRHQVFNEQDIVQDSMLSLGINDYDTCMPQVSVPFNSRHTTWNHGLPSPNGSDCTLANAPKTNGHWNRHGLPATDDLEMSRGISPYELVESDSYSRNSDMRTVLPRPLRCASEKKSDSGDETCQGDIMRSQEHGSKGKNPRSDQMYNFGPGADGLYRCPYSGTTECNHKPTKQKCIYDKNLDSHLKPYKCTEKDCEESSFSSNACLFRHQREAHGFHGHSAHLCHFSNCERAQPGMGFPRKWNLGDHMKRVHGYVAKEGSGDDSSRKRRVPSSAVPMRRSTSSKDKALAASSASAISRVDRNAAPINIRHTQRPSYPIFREFNGCNTAFPYQVAPMANPYDNIICAQHSRHSQPMVSY